MKKHCWLGLVLLCLTGLWPCICQAQTYQGTSGGYGGKYFDHWNESNGATDIAAVSLLIDNSVIRCISISYRDASGNITVRTRSGYCNPPPDSQLSFYGWQGFTLDRDEFLIGVAGRYGARIDSIRFYTNKRNSAVYGGNGGPAEFGYTVTSGQKIAAFIGRAGDNLDAIGVLYAPIR